MDFSKLDTAGLAEAGTKMVICYPGSEQPILGDDGKPAFIKMRGPSSDAMKAFARANEKQMLRAGSDYEGNKDFTVRFGIAATIEFINVKWEGKPLAFTPENAKMLYAKHEFIVAQMLAHFRDGDNFLPAPLQP
jgi:hypothetical protein